MRILLTGAAGWLGRHLKPRLVALGHEVVGLDIASSPWTDVQGTVADRAMVARLFREREFEAVVHSGALHKPDIARFPAQAFVDANVTGTLNLLEEAGKRQARFVFTSTTSLMISKAIREEEGAHAVWLDESAGPLEPRNVYGATKLAAESLCRVAHFERALPCVILRTSRFFPEVDDTHAELDGLNLKVNELLHRRLSVEDGVAAHLAALERASGFALYVISAPTPFRREHAEALKRDAAGLIAQLYPDAPALYAARGWRLPERIGRVYDAGLAERELGFRARLDFAAALAALRDGRKPPLAHDPGFVGPSAAFSPSAA